MRNWKRWQWITLAGVFFSCGAGHHLSSMSVVDARYRMQREGTGQASGEQPYAATFYRAGIGRTLGTDCRWFPSDSEYALRKNRQCGPAVAILKSFSRYTAEFDAYQISEGVVNIDERAHFYQFDPDCDLL